MEGNGGYMSLLSLVLFLALIGFITWLILQIPMAPVFHNVIIAVVAVFIILWILQQFGISTGFPAMKLK